MKKSNFIFVIIKSNIFLLLKEFIFKTSGYLLILLSSIPFALSLSSCGAGLPSDTEQTNKNLFVDMDSYTVSYPAGDDWLCKEERSRNAVKFFRYKKWITGDVQGATLIDVYENLIMVDTFKLGEKETATNYINNELQIMKDDVKKGIYKLENVFMSDTVLSGRKFYCMYYNTNKITMGEIEGEFDSDCILALYFPPDYPDKKKFYVFHINDSRDPGSLFIKNNAGQLYFVLRSFKMK